MNKYKIRYHFSNDFYVTREVESEFDKTSVAMRFSEEERITFEDKRGDLLSFFMRDVKLVTVEDDKVNTVKAGF
ncbi:hypothetical protein J9317_07385 [Metabacillus sp. KIGAM252]|uniref:DUF2283 domain-containing protein n=1 Tax=Metabacillus flavus TaxID=2823519 RepID=A0ABS5LCV8_9BACI|nr:hypothetical protein [Metabacillus flavus]MBS2968578.1 hypothetical protein [Metabacillus flavus]